MRHWRAALLLCALGLMLAGCGKKPAPTENEPTPGSTAPAANQPDNPAAPPAQQAATEAGGTQTAPADGAKAPIGVSEVDDDDGETVDQGGGGSKSVNIQTEPTSTEPVSQFKEGVNYQKLTAAQPTSAAPGHIEVAEVFWYGCPHCYALDPALESWHAKQRSPYIDFVRVPALWNETLKIHARMFYTAQVLGKLEELHGLIFRELQLNGNPLDTQERIASFFKAHGVAEKDFLQAFNSTAVQALLNQADILNRRYKIQSVPTIVVNGKYITDMGLAGSPEKLISLVNELAAREHGR